MSTVDIEVNGYMLDLPANFELQVELFSPLFDRENRDGSHSFSFRVPASPNNRLALGFADSPLIYDAQIQYEDSIIHAYGLPWMEGVAELTSAGTTGFSLRIEADMSPLAASLKKDMVKDVDFGGERILTTGTTVSKELSIEEVVPGGYAGLTVNGRSYFIAWNIGESDIDLLTSFEIAINQESNLTNVTASTNNVNGVNLLVIVAMVGFTTVSVDIYPAGNQQLWTLHTDIGLGALIHAEILDHMKQISLLGPGGADYCFAPVHAPVFYDDLNSDYQGYVNFWDWDAQGYQNNNIQTQEEWRNTAVPFPRLVYVLQQIFSEVGYTLQGSLLADLDFNSIYLWNNVNLDYNREDSNLKFNGYRGTFNIQNHVPQDWTSSEFVAWARDKFNLAFVPDFSTKSVEIVLRKDIPSQNPEDWTSHSLEGAITTRKQEKERGYELAHKTDETDLYGKDGTQSSLLKDYSYAGGVTRIETKAGPLIDKITTYPNTILSWRTPSVKQVGRSIWPGLEGSEGEPRLIMYRGMVSGPGGKTYPLATYGNTDYNGNVIGQFGLSWDSPFGSYATVGLFEYFWENWLKGREEEAEISQPMLIGLDKFYAIDYKEIQQHTHPDGYYDAVIKQLSITLTAAGPRATAKLHRL